MNSVLIVGARIPQPSAIVASCCPEPWTMRSAGAPVKGAVVGRASWLFAAARGYGSRLRLTPGGVRLAIADSRIY